MEERRRHEFYRKGSHQMIFHLDLFLALLQPERELSISSSFPPLSVRRRTRRSSAASSWTFAGRHGRIY